MALAAAEGLEYHFETYVTVNTFDAHRVTHLAKSLGLGLPIHERLLRAQLVEGEILDDPDTLVRLAAEVGVPEARDATGARVGRVRGRGPRRTSRRHARSASTASRSSSSTGATGSPAPSPRSCSSRRSRRRSAMPWPSEAGRAAG